MNTQVQKIKDEIESHLRILGKPITGYVKARIDEAKDILTFINSLPEEPAIKKLVSIDYATEQEIKKVYEQFENPEFLDYQSFAKIAHHFANWQKEQMMKDSFNAVVIPASYDDGWFSLENDYEEWPEIFGVVECVSKMVKEGRLKPDDNVKVIIIKENEQ